MKILAVLTPVVTSSLAHAATVAFYEQLFEQPASPSFEDNGLHITKISLAVVISAADEALLAIPANWMPSSRWMTWKRTGNYSPLSPPTPSPNRPRSPAAAIFSSSTPTARPSSICR